MAAGRQRVRVRPGAPASQGPFVPRLPGSKSHTTRALVLNHLSGGTTAIENASAASDCVVLARALERTMEHRGRGAALDAGEGGAPARFLFAVAALTPGRWRIHGSPRLSERPMAPLTAGLRALGVPVHGGPGLPLDIEGGRLRGGAVTLDGSASSQFASALLLVAGALEVPFELRVERPVSAAYLEVTVEVMEAFGVSVTSRQDGLDRVFQVRPGLVPPETYRVPADASGAAYFWVLGATGGRPVEMPWRSGDRQPDTRLLDCLEAMGAGVERGTGWVRVGGRLERGGAFGLTEFPDAAPALAVAALAAPAAVTITGVPHLALKESDRIAALAENLRRFGATVERREDGLSVRSSCLARAASETVAVSPHGDHRIAMAFAVLGALRPVVIEDAGCVAKSFPGFFDELGRALDVSSVDANGPAS